jgi:hypothetical protein
VLYAAWRMGARARVSDDLRGAGLPVGVPAISNPLLDFLDLLHQSRIAGIERLLGRSNKPVWLRQPLLGYELALGARN